MYSYDHVQMHIAGLHEQADRRRRTAQTGGRPDGKSRVAGYLRRQNRGAGVSGSRR